MKRRHRSTAQPMTQINLTSLLDIVFVLLITFMVVARAAQYRVDLELPTVREAPVAANDKPVNLSVTSSQGMTVIEIQSKVVKYDDIISELASQGVTKDSLRPVTLSADKAVPWEEVAKIIADLQAAGITSLGIMTDVQRG